MSNRILVNCTPRINKVVGDHEIHYNAFNSTFQPEVANLYDIAQDEDLGVAMVSVHQKDSAGVGGGSPR
jgi:hypothetical protein